MSLWDYIEVVSTDGGTTYEEGVDYEIDYEYDTIARLPGGNIPNGGQVNVRYGKGVPGDVLESLQETGSAILKPVKALLKILGSHDADLFESGTDISDKCVRVELVRTLGMNPHYVEFIVADQNFYAECDPSDDVIVGLAIGEKDSEGITHYVECYRGLVAEREFVSSGDGAHHVRVKAEDFSSSLDSPHQAAMGKVWGPRLRREVFRNGMIIADDYRDIRANNILSEIEFDDIVELYYAKEYPGSHQVIRDCFNLAESPFLTNLVLDCIDFPVLYMDGNEKTPGQVIREVASLAGASVYAEGTALIVTENGFPDGFRTAWVYDALTVLDESERNRSEEYYTAVQIFGHSETSRMPTRSIYLPPTDFTHPGWVRVLDEEGTLEPSEPVRTDEIPQPAELTFQLDGELYDPYSINVIGGELKSRPTVSIVDGKPIVNVTILVEWAIEDKAGECPYIEDEDGNKLFRILGRVYDAVPNSNGENLPIAHASVKRQRLDGDEQGEIFDLNADENGAYIFEAVPIGSYKIIASAPGYTDNFSDNDPDNDEIRDLYEELIEYENEIEQGRYEKRATDYHVIVWARPKVEMGPLADLTVSMVLLEVRDLSTKSGEPLVYGPAIRDNRVTTEVMARRIGQIMLAGSKQMSPSIKLRLPLNRWLRAGDGIRITGDILGFALPESRSFQATEVRRIFEPESGKSWDLVTSAPDKTGALLMRGIGEDPLDTRVGVVTAVYRNEIGGRVYDVSSAGSILYGLKAYPLLGELAVGESVQVARITRSALSYLVVARTTDVFPEERVCYV
ncbi:MAG: carboxypeptidase-like regulatory domain-containing protein [bacterium]|nr:carboxypeptidase-like regulatory domain-containing protein [bacterium]